MFLPGPHLFGVQLAPLGLHRIKRSQRQIVVLRGVNGLEVLNDFRFMLDPDFREGRANLVDDTVLYIGLRIRFLERSIESG
ncbi:hypothetical protein D3C87_2002400 [compost metagenome]